MKRLPQEHVDYEFAQLKYAAQKILDFQHTAIPMGEAVAYKNAMLESFLLHAYVLYAGLSVKRQKKATYLHLVLDAAHTNLIGPLSGRGNSPKLPLDSEALYGIGGELQRLYKRGQ